MPFQSWCQTNGYNPKNLVGILEAIEAYIESMTGAVAMCRLPQTSTTRAQAIQAGYVPTHPMPPLTVPGPAGPQRNPALVPWMQGYVAHIDLRVNNLQALGVQQIAADVLAAGVGNPIANATAAIPSPYDYYGNLINANSPLAKAHVVGYIDFLIGAIRGYIDNAVNHSNRRKRIRDAVVSSLQAAKANGTYLPPDKNIDSGVFNRVIPGAGEGANTLVAIADFWSAERTGTGVRKQQFIDACNAVAGPPGPGFDLRRYGSAAEGVDIRQQRGFYQKAGISFEQYKWFLDLRVLGATTSVSDSDRAFFVKLKGGALAAIHGIEQEYDADDQPPVIHKPNMGGEVGCFGVHEDCLVDFNTRMVASIQIKNQVTRVVEPGDVIP